MSKTTAMPQQLKVTSYQTLICSLEDFLAKRSQSQVNDSDLRTQEALSFLMSHGFSETKDPDILYSKTLKVFCLTTLAKLSRQYLKFSPTQGTELAGLYIIPRTMEYRRTGSVSTLSEVLEENVDPKYFLSPQMTEKILSQTKDGVQSFSRPSGRPITRTVITSPSLQTSTVRDYGSGGNKMPIVTRQPLRFLDRNQKNIEGDYAFTVDASQTSGVRIEQVAVDLTRREDGNHRVRKDGRAGTLDANYYKGLANQERPGVKDGTRIRRLTPTECVRLQGFPDGWNDNVSETQQYKQAGNAMTVNVVEHILRELNETL